MNKLIKRGWPTILIFIIPLPSLFWLPSGTSLAYGLFYPWSGNFSTMFGIATQYLNLWMPGGLGLPNTEPSGFLFYFIISLFAKIGGTPHIGQILFLYFGFTGILAGVYFLSRTLKLSRISSIVAGVFYLFAVFVFTGMPVSVFNIRLIPYHIITPIMLAVFIRAIKTRSFLKELALFGIVCLLASAGYGSLQYFILHLIIFAVYGLFSILLEYKNQKELKITLARLALLFGTMFLINYYWLSYFIFNFQAAYNLRAEPSFSDSHDIDMAIGTSSKIIDVLRMMPYVAQKFISPWVQYYYEVLPTTVLFILLAIIPTVFFDKEKRKLALFPAILLAISLFLVKGTNEPFAFLGKIILFIHPYFTRLFRNVTYFEIIAILPLSLLIGLSTGVIIKKIKQPWLLRSGIVVLMAMLIILGAPFIGGVAIKQTNIDGLSQYNIAPKYFEETLSFLMSKKEQDRINSIPAFTVQDMFVAYKWESIYKGVPPSGVLSGKSLYRPLYPQLVGKVDIVLDSVLHPQDNTISKEEFNFLSATANVRYITLHKDTAWDSVYNTDPKRFSGFNMKNIEGFLSKNDSIEKIETFGKIDVYSFRDNHFLQQLYIPQSIFVLKGDLSDFSKMFSSSNYQLRSTIYSEDWYNGNTRLKDLVDKQNNAIKSEEDASRWFAENENMGKFVGGYCEDWIKLPVLEFKKVNPTKYKVLIHNAIDVFPLVDSESFHNGWKVYLTDQNNNLNNNEFVSGDINGTIQNNNLSNGTFYENWFKEPIIEEQNHLVTNIYANSWIIDPINICQNNNGCTKNPDGSYDFELTIEYQPQKLFYIGMGISGLTVLVCIMYLILVNSFGAKKKGIKRGKIKKHEKTIIK